ncbi:alpha/beta fold hydrolase [bacterium]|nr:alpha/beta fold hydrolase [bacterium]
MNHPFSPHFEPPRFFRNPDLQTVLGSSLRPIRPRPATRERIQTSDGDFLDLDLMGPESSHVVIICHGLEGSAQRAYVQGMARTLLEYRDETVPTIAALNFRGCSGEPNRKPYSYHSGSSDDLREVIAHLSTRFPEISLVGFSLGGNVVLKYLGEMGARGESPIARAVAISVPVDLAGCAERLALPRNRFYMRRFLRMLHEKLSAKEAMFPNEISVSNFHELETFADFDGRYIAPLHGFRDAKDYWEQCSSLPLLSQIRVPTLLINAQDDPFLHPRCFPHEVATVNPHFSLLTPQYGGHVGFFHTPWDRVYWSEQQTAQFLFGRDEE